MTVHTCPGQLTGEQRRAFTARNDAARGVVIARLAPGYTAEEAAAAAVMLELGFPRQKYRNLDVTDRTLAACWVRAHDITHIGLHGAWQLSPAALDTAIDLAENSGANLWLSSTPVRPGWVETTPDALAAIPHSQPRELQRITWASEVTRYRHDHTAPVPYRAAVMWHGHDSTLLERLTDVTDGDQRHALTLHADIVNSRPWQQRDTMNWRAPLCDWRPWAALAAGLYGLGMTGQEIHKLTVNDVANDGAWVTLEGFRVKVPAPIATAIRAGIEWATAVHSDLANTVTRLRTPLMTSAATGTDWPHWAIRTHARGVLFALDRADLCQANN